MIQMVRPRDDFRVKCFPIWRPVTNVPGDAELPYLRVTVHCTGAHVKLATQGLLLNTSRPRFPLRKSSEGVKHTRQADEQDGRTLKSHRERFVMVSWQKYSPTEGTNSHAGWSLAPRHDRCRQGFLYQQAK
ncbi:uncharacterized protein LOC121875648 [Homarus americanus]|uniref:uncharacterized protein LOC121875648 n=1 Tax=Homarus americanus TaxID=6706 RepID=UPI001C458C4A|nr:uncharacterized protein LOC121875648 [Homarus americanus]